MIIFGHNDAHTRGSNPVNYEAVKTFGGIYGGIFQAWKLQPLCGVAYRLTMKPQAGIIQGFNEV